MSIDQTPTKLVSKSFTELEVWKKMRHLKIKVDKIAKDFSIEEKFKLTDQLIRSARGVNSAIAEGHGRYTFPDRIHYCIIARGSLSETYNHLIDAYDCTYITLEKLTELKNEINEVEKILNGYINWLRDELKKIHS
jgi:four helix bundle protein